GNIGPLGPALYIEFVRKAGDEPGCFVPGAGTPDMGTWVFYPAGNGVILPAFQADHWYRAASIAGIGNDGGIHVTATWEDLTSGEVRGTSFDFPVECTPTWWDTANHRPQFGGVSFSSGRFHVRFADLFIRPPRP